MTTSATVPPIESVAPSLKTRAEAGTFDGTQKLLLGLGGLGLVASLVGWFVADSGQFLFSYLVSYMFVLSLALGSMFFVLVQHLTRAGWSVVVRRVAENLMGALPVLAILFIPIAIGYHTLFHHWVDKVGLVPGDPGYDAVLAGKSGYLNVPFLFIRAGLYFAIWIGIATWFRRTSIKQDETGDPQLTLKMARVAAPCMLLFALTITFAAVDWMMALDPHWFSTIFGVYYFSGSFLASMSLLALVLMWMRRKRVLDDAVGTEHYHDVGKLMFAFVVFWTYIAFSQYMLIWYANLPEETMWYQHHLAGSWATIGDLLIVGHFLVPFAFLMSRHVKRARGTLGVAAVFLLFMHWVDMYWVIMPTHHHHGVHLSWLDFTTMIGLLGLFLGVFVMLTQRSSLLPVRDPRLRESLDFVNH
jgi:hypothetical protein